MSKKVKLGGAKIKQKLKLFGAAFENLSDPFLKLSQITLKGNREVIIDGCYGIIEYSDCFLSVNIGGGTLNLIGLDFSVSDYKETNIIVKGIIKSIEFC